MYVFKCEHRCTEIIVNCHVSEVFTMKLRRIWKMCTLIQATRFTLMRMDCIKTFKRN